MPDRWVAAAGHITWQERASDCAIQPDKVGVLLEVDLGSSEAREDHAHVA